MPHRQAIDLKAFWWCLTDYHMWPIYLLGLTWLLPQVPMSQYLTLILKDAGYGTFTTNLLSIPAYCFFILNLLFWCFLSEKINERFLLCTASQFFVLPCLLALELLPPARSPWTTWILSALIYAEPYVHPVIVAITSRNAGTVRTRTVASALYNMMVQTSNIIGSNVSVSVHYAGGVSFADVTWTDLPHTRQSQLLHWQQSAVGTCGIQHLRVCGRKDFLCKS